jgi:hypothetical protein
MNESYLDGLLDELVPTEPEARWDDVVHRARRDQRRYMAVVIAVAALGLAACSWVAVKAFEGTPAPPPVRGAFEFSNRAGQQLAKRMGKAFPQAEVAKAHGVLQVQTKDGPLDLWAAPATDGGACFLVGWEADNFPNLAVGDAGGCAPTDHPPPIGAGTMQGSDHPYTVVYGYAADSVATAQVKLGSGRTVTLPVVEHFFLAALPIGSAVAAVTGRDARGKIVGMDKLPQP